MANPINITPGHGKGGRHPTAETLAAAAKAVALAGHDDPGMFGRMFSNLPGLKVPDAALQELADAMKDSNPPADPQPADGSGQVPADAGDNEHIPAGFTYLGQFIDHDITLDLTSLAEKEEDPLATENFRTPRLDLDALYGLGPDGSPQLYARSGGPGASPGPKFFIGKTTDTTNEGVFRNDLPRSPEGFALIGDHRNDENLLVQQTHLAMLKFHNKVCDMLAGSTSPPPNLFAEARKIVTWHYQWMVLHDFVERLTEDGIVARILHDGRKFYRFKKVPYMPVEFSAAAYRLGHSMVRDKYSHNKNFEVTTLGLMFRFTGLSGGIMGEAGGTATFPTNWIIDWRRYHEVNGAKTPGLRFNHTRKLDPRLAQALHSLPGGGGSLPFRNLRRGVMLGLPSGQDVAKHMKIKKPLTPAEIADGSPDGNAAKKHGLHEKTPLWYYILKEAEKKGDGKRLGPVGATIVAEVFIGLVAGDKNSYLSDTTWKPTLPAKTPGTFTMADLLNFVGDLNPLGV